MKIKSWVRYARTHLTWATHIVKMDLDTYPFTSTIYNDFASALSSIRQATPEVGTWKKDCIFFPGNTREQAAMAQSALEQGLVYYGRAGPRGGKWGQGGMLGAFYALGTGLLGCWLREVEMM